MNLVNFDDKHCRICNTDQNLKACSICRSVFYCSKEHQAEDWLRHKESECRELLKLNKQKVQEQEFKLLIQKAIEIGDKSDQFRVAIYYTYGRGVELSMEEAVRWYLLSAYQGYPNAELALADCYRKGDGVIMNKSEAIRWYHKAAMQNIPRAQLELANCYRDGEGVALDISQAIYWYNKAAQHGIEEAQINLCRLGHSSCNSLSNNNNTLDNNSIYVDDNNAMDIKEKNP